MSMLNPTPVPVKYYASTDPEAPPWIRNTQAGIVKTILKACLVTGYGGKPSAGWEIQDEDGNKATFVPPDPSMQHLCLAIDGGGSRAIADIVWQDIKQGIHEEIVPKTPTQGDYGWYVVASSRGCLMIVTSNHGSGISRIDSAYMVYFGQLCSNLKDDLSQNFALFNSAKRSNYTESSDFYYIFSETKRVYTTGLLTTSTGSKTHNAILQCATLPRNDARMMKSRADMTTANILHGDAYVVNNDGIIGRVPGILVASHRADDVATGDIVQIEGSPHNWLYTNHEYNTSGTPRGLAVLVNIEQWVY